MPGMHTQMHAVINKTGDFKGFSANYSGAGFSGMYFTFHGLKDAAAFDKWIADAKTKGSSNELNRDSYLKLAQPTEEHIAPISYAKVNPDLFNNIVDMCVQPGSEKTTCRRNMRSSDALTDGFGASKQLSSTHN